MTKIADLPDGNTGSLKPPGLSNTYLPMDVHPNPYGMPPPPPGGIMPPEHTPPVRSRENPTFDYEEHSQKLPQRDIPMNISAHVQDEEIKANYIPPPPRTTTGDYIKEFQKETDAKIREHESKKNRERVRETWLDELQIPIMICLLFFVFQLPIINTLVFKRFSFLSIYNEDGNFNLLGVAIKSVIFALMYYLMYKGIEYVN
jgi:hypothetical protein